MAAEQLDAELSLDISGSLASVESLGSAIDGALSEAVESFSSEMEGAVSGIPDVDLAIEADASAIEPAISAEIDGTDTEVAVDADASAIGPAIDAEVEGADSTVDIDATVDEIGPAIDAAVESADATVTVDADTSAAESSIGELGESAAGATPQIQGTVDATSALGGVSGLATGGMSGLGGAVGALGGHAAATAGVIGAAGAGLAMFFNEAVEAQGATQRFNAVLGENASAVENLENIKGLNMDLGELALTLGSDDDKIRSVAARLYELATASGKSTGEASDFTQKMVALGARAVAINPLLGDMGDVTDGLSTALVRGGRFASKYGLDLNQADINARALNMTHKTSTEELSFVEKAMAGAQLASEKYGGNLETVVARGAENAITKQRRLKQTVTENIEALGQPLVAPIFELMEASIPTVQKIGELLSTLGTAAIPVVTAALSVLNPILTVVAEVLEAIPEPVLAAATAFMLFRGPTEAAGGLMRSLGGSAMSMSDKLGRSVAGIGLAVMGFQELTKEGGNAALGLGEMALAGATLGSVIPGVGTAAGAAAGALAGITMVLLDGGESVDEYRKKFTGLADDLDEFGTKASLDKFIDTLGESDAALAGLGERAGMTESEIGYQFQKITGSAKILPPAVKAITDELRVMATESPANAQKVLAGLRTIKDEAGKPLFTGAEFDVLVGAVDKGTAAYGRHHKNAVDAKTANDAVAASATGVATSESAQADATEKLNASIDAYVGKVSGSMPTVATAFDNAKAAAEHYGAALSPEVLLAGLNETLTQTVSFTSNLKTIFGAGFTDLGALLQEKGAVAGGAVTAAMADAIRAGHPETAAELNTKAQQVNVAGQVAAGYARTTGAQVVANTDAEYARLAPIVAGYMGLSAAEIGNATPVLTENAQRAARFGVHLPFGSGIAPVPEVAGETMQEAAGKVAASQGPMAGAAQGTGAAGTTGLDRGMAPMPGVAEGHVLGSVNAAAMAGANAHNVGYGIGAAFSEGIADGIDANTGYIQSFAREAVRAAKRAAESEAGIGSPSKLFRDAVGKPIAQGIAVGIETGTSEVASAAAALVNRASTFGSRQAAGYGVPGGAYSVPGSGRGSGGQTIVFNIKVEGVTSPAVARNVGEQVGEGAVDALMRRGVVVSARLG